MSLRVEEHPHALADIVDGLAGFDRGDARRLLLPVLERRGIERPDLGLAGGALAPLVESLAGLFAERASLDQRIDERRHGKGRAIRVARQALVQVAHHVREHVDARDIHRPERRASGTAQRRAGDRIDLFDGVLAAGERIERPRHAVEADVIADEVRRVLGNDDALAEHVIAELRPSRPRPQDRFRRSE